MTDYGQINPTTKRWEIIQKTIKNNNFNTIVEIGTWKGMGSTLSVLTSKNDDTNFITLESNLEFYTIAKKNLSSFEGKFNQLFGRIVDVEEVINFTENYSLSPEQIQWLNEDISNFKDCPNVLESLPEKIDFLILDGGEFSTYSEWTKLKNRSEFVALDDINVLKCEKIYNELLQNSEYTLIEKTDEGHGFCVFRKN